jgi:hypothetical protein
METMAELYEKAEEIGLSGPVFTLGTANSACSVGFYARISGIRENPLKYTDPDGKVDVPKILGGYSLILGSAGIIVVTVIEDFGTLGAGIADDLPSVLAAGTLFATGRSLIESGLNENQSRNPTGQNFTSTAQAIVPSPAPQQPDNNDDQKRTEHGEKRHNEARNGDPHRNIGDPNRTMYEGKHFTDTKTGNEIYVKGNKGVVIKDGKLHSQFHNTKANTLKRIQEGRWIPNE